MMKLIVFVILTVTVFSSRSQTLPLFEGELIVNDSTIHLDEILKFYLKWCEEEDLIFNQSNISFGKLSSIVLTDTSWTLTAIELKSQPRSWTVFITPDSSNCTGQAEFRKRATIMSDIKICEVVPSSNIISLNSCMKNILSESINSKNDLYIFFAAISSSGSLINIQIRIPPFDIEQEGR